MIGSNGLRSCSISLAYPSINLVLPVSKIRGFVKDVYGIPLTEATVATTGPSGTTYTTYADSSGYYSLTVGATGAYSLAASASGYTSQTKSVSVTTFNTEYRVDFALLAPPAIAVQISAPWNKLALGQPMSLTVRALSSGAPVSGASVVLTSTFGLS